MSEGITNQELSRLKKEFPENRLNVMVRALNQDRTQAMLVVYVQHKDVQERIEEIDPSWTCRVLEEKHVGNTWFIRLSMTVKGVERQDIGEGDHPKAALSDAIKRAAMRFGVGRYLYDWEKKWVPYNEGRDKYRDWTIEDYHGRQKVNQAGAPGKGLVKDIQELRSVPNKEKEERWSGFRTARDKEDRRRGGPDLAKYVVKFGKKFKGYTLEEIDPEDLLAYMQYVQEADDPTPEALEFLEAASEYVSTK